MQWLKILTNPVGIIVTLIVLLLVSVVDSYHLRNKILKMEAEDMQVTIDKTQKVMDAVVELADSVSKDKAELAKERDEIIQNFDNFETELEEEIEHVTGDKTFSPIPDDHPLILTRNAERAYAKRMLCQRNLATDRVCFDSGGVSSGSGAAESERSGLSGNP